MADRTYDWTGPGGTSGDSTQPYDIFISHRGPDTKEQFCKWLRNELHRCGYHAFLDDTDLPISADAWETMKGNLRRAKLVIVVLSKAFGRSQWCLDELKMALAMEGKEVLPVFYDVMPEDLHTLLDVKW
jgi:hypothetical protein